MNRFEEIKSTIAFDELDGSDLGYLISEIERKNKALEFYTDLENYITPPISVYGSIDGSEIMVDHGIISKKALEEEK